MNTVVLEPSPNGPVPVDVMSKMTSSRILFLSGEINEAVAVDLVATLIYLNSQSDQLITIFLNAYSDDIRSILMVCDFMKSLDSQVRIVCSGESLGAATLLLASADESLATPSSFIMFGPMQSQSPMRAQIHSAEDSIRRAHMDNKKVFKILSDKMKKTYKQAEEMFKTDLHFTAKTALKAGLIDGIAKTKK